MLSKKQRQLYDAFYDSTHQNEFLDHRTELLVGLSASIAMNCQPCTQYYLDKAKVAGVGEGEIGEVLAKVMAVAAGQKRLQTEQLVENSVFDVDSIVG